jgi:protein-S-isoprenylcysteine O-methyltransferase Ste14
MIVVVLILVIFDFRFRGKSILGSKIPVLIGAMFPLYCLGYLLVLFGFLNSVTVMDWISFVITVVGLILVVKARIDLKDYYTWPGQFKQSTKLIEIGLYKWIRHPIYFGIFLFVLGSLITVIAHSVFILGALISLVGTSLLAFTYFAIEQEEYFLKMRLGGVYLNYKYRVDAFFPIKINQKKD